MCKGRDCVRESEVRHGGQVLPEGDRDEEIQMCEKQVRLGLSGGGGGGAAACREGIMWYEMRHAGTQVEGAKFGEHVTWRCR